MQFSLSSKFWPVSLRPWLRRSLAFCLALLATVTVTLPSQAQFSLPENLGQLDDNRLPAGVERFGGMEVAPVRSPIDNEILFRIASPTVYDRSDAAADQRAVEQRAKQVQARLRLAIFNRRMDPETLAVEVSRLNNVTVVDVRDNDYPRPLILVSVTEQDADYNGQPIADLAADWQDILGREIRQGQARLSQAAVAKSLGAVVQIVLLLLGLTAILGLIKHALSKRQKVLRQRKQDLNDRQPIEPPVDPQQTQISEQQEAEAEFLTQKRNQFLQAFQQTLNLDRRLGLWNFIQWLLFWLIILAWYIGIFFLGQQFPGLSTLSGYLLSKPLQLLAIWFFTSLAIRISRRLIDRFKATWQDHDFSSLINLGNAQRRKLRISTIAGAAKGLASVVIATTGLLAALGTVGIPTGSVLAIGGLLGLAISFGSQNLVKDLVNGFLILAEDQYAIGDVIDLGNSAGLVENLNLRVTQLRSSDGELVTIPNSAITQVKNLTRTWSRVSFSIDVAYQTDPNHALRVLEEVAQGLYDDPAWHDKILAPPDVLGIDSVSNSGMTITTWIQTGPAQQWAVGREFRLRVRAALEANGIEIGTPRQTYALESSTARTNGQSHHLTNRDEGDEGSKSREAVAETL